MVRISGKYITPIPEHVYAPCGGFDKLHEQHKEQQRGDAD